jgi:hypothetical protein
MEFVNSISPGRAVAITAPVRSSAPMPMRSSPMLAATDPRAAGTRRYEGGQLVWRVQCGDLIDRERCVTVFVEQDQVVLVGPPGETARLTSGQLGQLRAALNEAAKLAER